MQQIRAVANTICNVSIQGFTICAPEFNKTRVFRIVFLIAINTITGRCLIAMQAGVVRIHPSILLTVWGSRVMYSHDS